LWVTVETAVFPVAGASSEQKRSHEIVENYWDHKLPEQNVLSRLVR